MRIAVTGTHGCGKSTLIDDFASVHSAYQSVPEPYWLLAQSGMPFADGPDIADLEQQLGESCKLILNSATSPDVIFDRCPLDFLAYLDVVSASEGFEWLPDGRLLASIGKAIAALDLIAFVPLLVPDEIATKIEYKALRKNVDRRLKAIMQTDDLGLLADGPPIIAITGSRSTRVARLAAALQRIDARA
ncbi:AAA family ATPase [Pelagibacterium luteolum]|uniref:AAA domain-containing protein n=1 Tax=Pelagibacterium luteolum TaxID=440168 RepID=A0A1G7WRM5_9HYPH|nr:AAA family ATPase [Pelagibacterium luteolum]SDG74554.1 AAA domain-containing protein [Pelagibacterium luteolum]